MYLEIFWLVVSNLPEKVVVIWDDCSQLNGKMIRTSNQELLGVLHCCFTLKLKLIDTYV